MDICFCQKHWILRRSFYWIFEVKVFWNTLGPFVGLPVCLFVSLLLCVCSSFFPKFFFRNHTQKLSNFVSEVRMRSRKICKFFFFWKWSRYSDVEPKRALNRPKMKFSSFMKNRFLQFDVFVFNALNCCFFIFCAYYFSYFNPLMHVVAKWFDTL